MKNFKKTLALVLSLMMVFSAISVVFSMPVSAAEAGDAYSVAINASNYTSYIEADKSISSLAAATRTDGAAASFDAFRVAKGSNGSVYFTFNDFDKLLLSDISLSWHGRAIMKTANSVAVYVSANNEDWYFISAIAAAGSFTPAGATEAITVSDNTNASPVVATLSEINSSLDDVATLYVRIDMVSATDTDVNWVYFADLTVSGTLVTDPYYYNADLTTLCDANGNAVENYTSRLVASDNIQVANSRNYSNNQHPMLVSAKDKEGYAILKFDDFNSKYLSAATLSYEGKANDSGDAIDVYISSTFDESAPTGDYWTRINGIGHGDNYATTNAYGSPLTADISSYVEKGFAALYVRIHFKNTGAVTQTLFSNLIIEGRLRDYQYEDFGVAFDNNFGADGAWSEEAATYVHDTANLSIGAKVLPEATNTDTYVIFKFNAGEGKVLRNAVLSWSGRGISNVNNYVNVFISHSLDAEWTYLNGIGHSDSGYATDNNESSPYITDLSDYTGEGVETLYVKVFMRKSYGSWAYLKSLAVSGIIVPEAQDNTTVCTILTTGLSDSNSVMQNQSFTFTAAAMPIQLTDKTVTATMSDDKATVTYADGVYTVTGVTAGDTTLTLTSGKYSKDYKITVIPAYIDNDFDATIDVTADTKVDVTKFYDLDSIDGVMANSAGATVKIPVDFAEFTYVGSNFVKATVAWGVTGSGVASFDVYVDNVAAENKLATLYATPFGSSITEQTVASFMNTVLKDTHDIYVVFNTPGSALIDITFGNFDGGYTGEYSRDYSDATATPDWVTKVINYHGLRATTGGAMGAKYGTDATIIYRVDATEGKTLTGFNYTLDGRYISNGKIANTVLYIYASADMNNWTLLNTISGKGDAAIGTSLLANNVLENVVSNGAETVYFKLVMNVPQSGGLDSWNILQQVKLNPVENDGVLGDTNADGVVDIVDLVRFKKVQAGIALVSDIADTAYFAGKNNTANDLIYTRKTIIGAAFDVDRSAFDVIATDTLPAQSPESKTPTIFEAMSLPVTTSADATAEYNADRIQFCLDNYGFVTLKAGEYYEIDSAIILDGKNEVLKTEDPENPAELSFWGDSWYVVQVKGTNNTLKDVIVNQNLNYTTGIHLDTAVVQVVDATNALLDGVTVMGDIEPESADTTYATGDIGTSYPAALYVLRSTAPVIKNSTFRNCFYGVIFHSSQTVEMNAVMDNCLVTYNRCDGITLAGYAQIKNSEICYNGYDCMNGGDGDPIPGAGIYVEANQVGFVIDNCEIHRNNGFNVDVNGAANGIITNNTIYDAGWTTFPEATDYVKVTYHNGVSLAISGLVGGTVTGNTVTNTNAATVLSDCYAHTVYGNDINGFFGYNNTGTAFGDIPEGGNIIVACFIARGSSNVTVEGNTFTAEAEGVTGYAIFVDYISSATIGENTTTGNVLQAVAVETEE